MASSINIIAFSRVDHLVHPFDGDTGVCRVRLWEIKWVLYNWSLVLITARGTFKLT